VKRIYVALAPDECTANFMFTPDEQQLKCTVAPAFALLPNKWGENGATRVTLSKLKVAELRSALEMAYQHALPKTGRHR
jgi:hypothetical protein